MTLLWLPYVNTVERLGGLPADLRADVWDGTGDWPASVAEVELYVIPYMSGAHALAPIVEMAKLQVIQTLSAGFDNIVPVLPDGVTLCNARGVHEASTAELAVALMLASIRRLPEFVRAADGHDWLPGPTPALADKTVLIVGYGSVGEAIDRRLSGFEVDVRRVARSARSSPHGPVDALERLPELLPGADVVVLCVPLTPDTAGLVDATFLARMRDGAVLVNVSRGSVVDTGALLAELASGRLRAAVDVTDPEPLPADHPFWDAPGLIVSPHVGGNTSAFLPRAYRLLADQLDRFATGQPLRNVVRP